CAPCIPRPASRLVRCRFPSLSWRPSSEPSSRASCRVRLHGRKARRVPGRSTAMARARATGSDTQRRSRARSCGALSVLASDASTRSAHRSRRRAGGAPWTVQGLAWFVRPASGLSRGAPPPNLTPGTTPARGHLMRLLPILGGMLLAPIRPVTGARPDVCSQTARAARHACANETRQDFWIASGVCANTSDPGARAACRQTAKREARDAAAGCGEQFHAREALCDALGPAAYAPAIDPGRFLSPMAIAARPNPFFPLPPGTTWVYVGGSETTTVTVTDQTRQILR